MKKLILLLAILIPMVANAMKIKTDKIDEFTDTRTVITSWESFLYGRMHIRFRLQNNTQFLDFKIMDEDINVVDEEDPLYLKSSDGHKTAFMPIGKYMASFGDGAVSSQGSKVWGIFVPYKGDIEWIKQSAPVTLMRITSFRSYIDRKLTEKEGLKLKQLATLFLNAVNGTSDKVYTINATLQYMKKKKTSNSWDIVETLNLDDVLFEDVQNRMIEWRANTDDYYDYDVKLTLRK